MTDRYSFDNALADYCPTAQLRISALETQKAELESKYARCNPLNEALAAKQKAESAARVATDNLNALQQARSNVHIIRKEV